MNSWPYSTRRWQRLRALVLSTSPLCRYCAEMGRVTVATVVDHTIRVKDRPDLAFELSNLTSMCAACHSGAKAREDHAGERIGCGADGVPLKGWE